MDSEVKPPWTAITPDTVIFPDTIIYPDGLNPYLVIPEPNPLGARPTRDNVRRNPR